MTSPDTPNLFNHSSEFIDRAGELTAAELKSHGPALAVALVYYYKTKEDKRDVETRQSADGLENFMNTIGINEAAAVQRVDWNKPLISSLLVPINVVPITLPQPTNNKRPWMDAYKGVGIVKSGEMAGMVEQSMSLVDESLAVVEESMGSMDLS